MKQHALLVAVAAMFLVAGCATRKAPPRKIVTVESKEPVEVRDAAHRVAVRVTDEATIVEIDERRFVCRGHTGYIGQLNAVRGWLKVGRLDFSYDDMKVWIRGPKSWATFDRTGRQNYFARQDGSVGRSVFKE